MVAGTTSLEGIFIPRNLNVPMDSQLVAVIPILAISPRIIFHRLYSIHPDVLCRSVAHLRGTEACVNPIA